MPLHQSTRPHPVFICDIYIWQVTKCDMFSLPNITVNYSSSSGFMFCKDFCMSLWHFFLLLYYVSVWGSKAYCDIKLTCEPNRISKPASDENWRKQTFTLVLKRAWFRSPVLTGTERGGKTRERYVMFYATPNPILLLCFNWRWGEVVEGSCSTGRALDYRSSSRAIDPAMIHTLIYLSSPGCPLPKIALQYRIEA